MPKLNLKASSHLLEVLLVFSAGLCRTWDRPRVLDAYPLLSDFQQTYRSIDVQLIDSNEPFTIENSDKLTDVLGRYSPRDLIIASAHHGHFIAFLSACARYGIPLAVCYKAASRSYLDAAVRNGLTLVDLNAGPNVLSLFTTLDKERDKGRYVAIMMDGPFAFRKRYSFLGYKIAASSLASLYARKARAALLPLISSVSPAQGLSFRTGQIIENLRGDATQYLLNFLQSIILQECQQHQWLSTSVLMSDQEARDNALTFLNKALAWREDR
jgi:lauroyl/myristoyl acyltransferase